MIETLAKVVACQSGWVTVEAVSHSSCNHCQQQQCGTGLAEKALAKRFHQLTLPYQGDIQPGDEVVLGLPERGLLMAAALMFLLPLLLILVAALLSQWLSLWLGMTSEWLVLLGAVLGGYAGFWLGQSGHRRWQGQRWLEPQLLRVTLPLRRISPESPLID